MARYFQTPIISFTDFYGNTFSLRDIRETPTYIDSFTLKIEKNDTVDEIASRKDIYGNQNENLSYKIIEHNNITLLDNKFDLKKIKELKIPV